MSELLRKNFRLDLNLSDALDESCKELDISFSELIRRVLINDGVVISGCKDIDFTKSYILAKVKNLTSQYRVIIWDSYIDDEFSYVLDITLDKIESIIVEELKVKKVDTKSDCYVENIVFTPSDNKKHRRVRIQDYLIEDVKGKAETLSTTFTDQITDYLTNIKFLTPKNIDFEKRKLVEIVRFGNCINAYLKTLHTKRKSSGLSIADYRDLEFKLEMFLNILVHKLAMVGIERQ
ncbi:hypothetical protein NFT52_004550 [Vibrio parahaemolyticus]|nr:hypothetical protein [Vibrio parahaemolyticus]